MASPMRYRRMAGDVARDRAVELRQKEWRSDGRPSQSVVPDAMFALAFQAPSSPFVGDENPADLPPGYLLLPAGRERGTRIATEYSFHFFGRSRAARDQ